MLFLSAVSEFVNYCQFEKHLSQKTLKAYRTDLAQLGSFLKEKRYSEEIVTITKTELRDYLVSLSSLKHKTIKRKLASAKAMFNYLEFEDHILVNPFRKMRINIREPKRLPKVMDMRDITRIFRKAYGNVQHQLVPGTFQHFVVSRNVVIVELLFNTGARVSEIAGLTRDSINLDTGSILIRGKGDKERTIQICNKEALDSIKQYHKLYSRRIHDAGSYFLVNRIGGKLSDQSIRAIVKNLALEAGLTKHITPHIFRHSFATLLLEQDVDIKYIQSLLGHSSIMTTQIYTHVNRAQQKKILKTKHPRKTMVMAETRALE